MSEEKPRIGAGVGVMIVRAGKVLLGLRKVKPKHMDAGLHGEETWCLPGGKMEYGETFENAAKRELMEETGIELKESRILCVNNDMNEYAHFITIGILAKKYSGEAEVNEPDEITEWRWFDLNKIPKNLFFPTQKIIECYKQGRFNLPEKE